MNATAEATTIIMQQQPAQPPAAAPLAPRHSPIMSGSKVMPLVPNSIDEVWRMAKAISNAGWAPKSYEHNAEKIAVGIMHGMEVGLTPIAALQSIAVINGMPSIFGDGALALVQSSGLLEDFRETPIKDNAGTVTGYKCYAKRRNRTTPIEQQFTLEDAQRAKLTDKSGPWKEYRSRMLQMRARAWVLRDGFADVLRGLAIYEEIRDITPEGETLPPAPPPPTRPASAASALDAFAATASVDSATPASPAAQAASESALEQDAQGYPDAPETAAIAPETPQGDPAAPAAASAQPPAPEAPAGPRIPDTPPDSFGGITLPKPPQDFWGKWAVHGQPMLLWRWITSAAGSVELNLQQAEVQALVDAYAGVIKAVAATDERSMKTVTDFINKQKVFFDGTAH